MEFNNKKILPLESEEALKARQDAFDSLLNFIDKIEKENKGKPLDKNAPYPQKYGLPLTDIDGFRCDPDVTMYKLHTDEMGEVRRVKIQIVEGLYGEGLLFLPVNYKENGKLPFIMSLHGGSGTPELASDTWGNSSNYSAMTRRVLDKGAIVFAPFLIVGSSPDMLQKLHYDENELDERLAKQGWSRLAIGATFLMRVVDYFINFPGVDSDKIGMIGMSWGSRFSILTAQFDERIKRIYGSCFLEFGEEAAKICPRHLVVEGGMWDEGLTPTMIDQLPPLYKAYRESKNMDKLRINFHGGDHMLDTDNRMLDWLFDPFFN